MSRKGKPHYGIYIETSELQYYNGNHWGREVIKKKNGDDATKFGTNNGLIIVKNLDHKIYITEFDVRIEKIKDEKQKLA